ncbi:MAG TPA: efflux RND transporter periplasmic adaptor subunit, partial [Rhabdochlamydiaceae bacterium]|nr:efflux RND transporter periplasmic adaptor subunit [Rhabdochlamydiaceae bacterium]
VPYVSIVKPEVADVPLFYEYIGHVEANQTVNVKAQAAGTILGQFFIEGQEVLVDSLLLTIDPRPFQAALDKACGELAQNLANLQIARETAERYAPLVVDEYISKLTYDQYLTNVKTAEAAVQQSQADVETAQINLGYCSLTAPFTGVASKLLINVGNYVPVGGAPLLTINQISPIRISVYAPEKDLPRIVHYHLKQKLKTMALLNEECIEGELFLIDNQVNEATGNILLQALFQNDDKKLWPGEFVRARIILDIKKDAILLPKQAIQVGQEGPYLYVVKEDNTVELRKVKLGQNEDEKVIVESGVCPGEIVVLEGQLNLSPGAKVIIQ